MKGRIKLADEKILDNEILDDEALDGVAGGSTNENRMDRELLKQMGCYNDKTKSISTNLQTSFAGLGSKLGCDLHVSVNANKGNVANKYFIADQEVSRDEFWTIINRLNDSK